MKIFAKRTRTIVDSETAEKLRKQEDAQKEREADKAVQELLKLDPSELNSKQRRLVKRYKERNKKPIEKQVSEEQQHQDESKDSVEETNTSKSVSQPRHHQSADAAQEESSSESSSENTSNNDADESVEEDDSKKDGATKESPDHTADALKEKTAAEDKPANDDKDDLEHQDKVKKVLEKLNSKQRRKLMRRLEREGNNIVDEVHEEAMKLLKEADASEKAVPQETPEAKQPPEVMLLGKKRNKNDWSDLPPEERLRREEQRRTQQEVAARRAKEGPNATKRHPLNSERRRANRRKPKWERKRKAENEHNMSGYHVRKLRKADDM